MFVLLLLLLVSKIQIINSLSKLQATINHNHSGDIKYSIASFLHCLQSTTEVCGNLLD